MKKSLLYLSAFTCIMGASINLSIAQKKSIGIFNAQADIGKVLHKGSAVYDAKTGEYILEGSGYNIWNDHDEFHFVWKKLKGDFIVKGNFAFLSKGGIDDKKIGWMIRTSLDTSSPHVIGVVHGAGLTSLQFRRKTGALTEEKKFSLTAADFIQLERKGHTYTVSVSKNGGAPVTEDVDDLNIGDDVYVGLFICSHDKNVSEKAVVHNVSIVPKK